MFWKHQKITNRLENVMINSSSRQFLNPPWYPLLGYLLTTDQCHLDYLCLKKLIRRNHSASFGKVGHQTKDVCAAKPKSKAIISGIMLWLSTPNWRIHTNINGYVKIAIKNWILKHPHVMQYPIANDCIKLYIDYHAIPQLVPKLLLQS